MTGIERIGKSVKSGAEESPLTDGLRWQCIGPFHGGRVVVVVGHPTGQNVFYFGARAGGARETSCLGTYWENVSDGFFHTAATVPLPRVRGNWYGVGANLNDGKESPPSPGYTSNRGETTVEVGGAGLALLIASCFGEAPKPAPHPLV